MGSLNPKTLNPKPQNNEGVLGSLGSCRVLRVWALNPKPKPLTTLLLGARGFFGLFYGLAPGCRGLAFQVWGVGAPFLGGGGALGVLGLLGFRVFWGVFRAFRVFRV